MIRLTFAMFLLVGFASVLLLMAVRAPTAEAEIPYCGHGYKTYVKTLPNGAVVYRIAYAWGSTGNQHLHHYRIYRLKKGYWYDKWIYLRSFDRVCLDTHPV